MKEKLEKAKNWVKEHKRIIAEGVLFVGCCVGTYLFGYGWSRYVDNKNRVVWNEKTQEEAKNLPPFETGNVIAFANYDSTEETYSGAIAVNDVDIDNIGKFGSEIAKKIGARGKCDVRVYYSNK